MTKHELSQLRYLSSEIELLRKQIEDAEYAIEKASDVVSGSNREWPYEPRKFHVEGVAVPDYEDKVRRLKRKLERRTEELIDKREELEEYIATIPDSLIRQILTLRYVNGLSWAQVAAHIGGGNTADSVRMAHNRFLREN
jgi:DNA repair ATPase RecN